MKEKRKIKTRYVLLIIGGILVIIIGALLVKGQTSRRGETFIGLTQTQKEEDFQYLCDTLDTTYPFWLKFIKEGANTIYKILIVEDDLTIAKAVQSHLTSWSFECSLVTDFENVLVAFADISPHLVLLDISLPFYNGFYWCSEIRKLSTVPILFISSASDNMNIVMAMNMGGDDLIAKPFALTVLTAKIQALLRRSYSFGGESQLLEHGGAILNTNDASLTYKGNKIQLTKNEYRILQVLMENAGHIVSRDALMTKLWETDSYIDENTLTVNITRLRRKLDSYHLENFISTKKGIGYVID